MLVPHTSSPLFAGARFCSGPFGIPRKRTLSVDGVGRHFTGSWCVVVTPWGSDKMTEILGTTFWRHFIKKKSLTIWINFHWSSFLTKMTISQRQSRKWIYTKKPIRLRNQIMIHLYFTTFICKRNLDSTNHVSSLSKLLLFYSFCMQHISADTLVGSNHRLLSHQQPLGYVFTNRLISAWLSLFFQSHVSAMIYSFFTLQPHLIPGHMAQPKLGVEPRPLVRMKGWVWKGAEVTSVAILAAVTLNTQHKTLIDTVSLSRLISSKKTKTNKQNKTNQTATKTKTTTNIKHKNISAFHSICSHFTTSLATKMSQVVEILYTKKTRLTTVCKVNTITGDNLATQGARALTTMVLI